MSGHQNRPPVFNPALGQPSGRKAQVNIGSPVHKNASSLFNIPKQVTLRLLLQERSVYSHSDPDHTIVPNNMKLFRLIRKSDVLLIEGQGIFSKIIKF